MISVALEEVQREGVVQVPGLAPSVQYTTQSVHLYLPPFQYISLSLFISISLGSFSLTISSPVVFSEAL